jgi:hypothetical protein
VSLATVSLTSAQELPIIDIISPAQGATVVGPDVTVEVLVTDFTLVPPTGTDANPGKEGHIIYYLDVEPVFMPGQPAIPSDPDAIYAASEQLTNTFENVAPGSHDVWVLLVLDDHTPVIPPAIEKVGFTVTASSGRPTTQPSPSATERARSVLVEQATPVPTPTSPPTPTPVVSPAQVPNAGGTLPAESGAGPSVWPFLAAAVGVIAVVGGGVAAVRTRRGRR